MEKYVQYGFKVEERNLVFGENDWNKMTIKSYEELSDVLNKKRTNTDSTGNSYTIIDIIQIELWDPLIPTDWRVSFVTGFPDGYYLYEALMNDLEPMSVSYRMW